MQALFDPRGNLWSYVVVDDEQSFRRVTGSLPLGGFDAIFPGYGGPSDANPRYTPAYWSLTFDPYTDSLFALAIPIRIYQLDPTQYPDLLGEVLDQNHFILCSINLQTAQPEKVIATYDRPSDSNWSLTIAWGFAPPE